MSTYQKMEKETAERKKVRNQINPHFSTKFGPISAVYLIRPYEEASLQCLQKLLKEMEEDAARMRYEGKIKEWSLATDVLTYGLVSVSVVVFVLSRTIR
jgi:hypothetical protein